VFVVGLPGLIPFGLLLALSIDSDEEARRSVSLTRRNLALAVVMVAALAWFWLWYLDLSESMRVLIAGTLIALPVALQESTGGAARERAVTVTKRNLILALWALVIFIVVYQDMGVWFFGLAAVCVVLPLVLASSRCGAPAGGGSKSGCSATRFAGTCGSTSGKASTSGCAAPCSLVSWPQVARTSPGSGSL
jgi:hypothetical protein